MPQLATAARFHMTQGVTRSPFKPVKQLSLPDELQRYNEVQHKRKMLLKSAVAYTQGKVTSQTLWSQYDGHFVGITRHNAFSEMAKICRFIQIKLNHFV